MRITVNDEDREVAPGATAATAAALAGIADGRGVALAVNGVVLPRDGWEGRALAEGDRVLVIRAAQGG